MVGLALVACGGQSQPQTSSSSGPPIKIGFLDTMTGSLGAVGQATQEGAQIAVDEINAKGGVNGSKLQLETKDEQANATATTQAMRDFASEGVQIVVGFTSSADCLAAIPIAQQNNMVLVSAACADRSLQTTKFSKNFFSIAVNTDEMTAAAAQYAKDKLQGVNTWNNLSYDYVTGHDYWTGFQSEMKKRNSSVQFNKSVFFPLTETQVTPYITSLLSGVPSDKSQGLFLSTFGGGTIAVAKQGQPYDLFNKFKIILNVGGGEDVSASIGASGGPITYIHDYYWTAYKNSINDYLVKQFQSRPKQGPQTDGPHTWVYQGYTAVHIVADAIAKAKKSDGQSVMNTLPGMHFNSAKGDISFRKEDHMMIQPMTVFTCQGAGTPVGFSCPTTDVLQPSTFVPPANPTT